ncbi:hypothetical protein DPMN_149835 [Dreissena polymorpha]|uniref:Uncharacterized protein n=1 Tax=Dreissena polymorpha TaxID=45954 RepID=A0A9D4J5P9_DREPO|nr:hypothetical protein DPMN_149835 [Dreissena polymorpha]
MPVASRQSVDLPMYHSYTGTLPHSPGLLLGTIGDNRSVVVALPGSVWAPVGLRIRPGCSRYCPGCSGAAPVLPVDSRFIPEVLNILILSRWSPGCPRFIPVVPGEDPINPGGVPDHAPGLHRHLSKTGPLYMHSFNKDMYEV